MRSAGPPWRARLAELSRMRMWRQLARLRATPAAFARSTSLFVPSLLLMATPSVMHAQGIRIRGTTTMNFLELRPFVDDSLPFGVTSAGAQDYRQTATGQLVRCTVGDAWCYFKRSGAVANALPVLQDLDVSAWGLGQGISAHANVRIRGAMGSQPALWPRAEDRFDALSAYLQLDRGKFTARAGRQYATSGLGLYNYDGASLQWRPIPKLTIEGFGGWSLAQGVNESLTTSEIAAVDELPPDRNAYLVGAELRARPTDRSAVHALYQRELRTNRSALYSERVAVDGTWRLSGTSLEGALTQDLSTNQTNELRLRVRAPAIAQTVLSVEARHFRPFFELWTIWGAFAPVGFDEGRLQASWHSTSQLLSFDVHGARRKWQATNAGVDFQSLRTDGWRVGGAANWRAREHWNLNGSYSADVGFGSSRSEGDLGVHFDRGPVFLGLTGTAFQSIYEFRVGTGRVIGTSVDAGWQMTPEVRVIGDVSLYQQTARNNAPSTDWTQHRASLRFEWTVGSDPGNRYVNAAARKAAAKAKAESELARVASSKSSTLPAMSSAPEGRP